MYCRNKTKQKKAVNFHFKKLSYRLAVSLSEQKITNQTKKQEKHATGLQ